MISPTHPDVIAVHPLDRWYPPVPDRPTRVVALTPMQCNMLTSLCEDKSNEAIARDWGVEVDTVKTHLKRVFRAIGVTQRVKAVALVWSGEVEIHRKRPTSRWPDPGPPIEAATLRGGPPYPPRS